MGCGGSKRRVTGVAGVTRLLISLIYIDILLVTPQSESMSAPCYRFYSCYNMYGFFRRLEEAQAAFCLKW